MNLSKVLMFNPFAKFFQKNRVEEDLRELEVVKNSQGISQEQLMFGNGNFGYDSVLHPDMSMTHIGVQFDEFFNSKVSRILKYREMALFPEVCDALDAICDEAISPDADGEILNLNLKKEVPRHIEDQLREHWEYLINDILSFNERGWDFFRKWLIEAEIFTELILNDEGDDIIGIKVLPAHMMMPLYKNDDITGYLQVIDGVNVQNEGGEQKTSIPFDKDQIVYTNYGIVGDNVLDIRGYLESAIKTYNQLKSLEDSLVVYRLVRAPERRVWNIAVGRMPKGKADEYIRGLIQRYKKRITYDATTGAMDAAQNIQSLTEDFWFARNESGEGTTVETIGGGMSLGEIEDVKYFLEKLYKTLRMPKSRWEDSSNSMYNSGKSGEILREEIKFSKFVQRLQRRFKYFIIDMYITLLKIRGMDSQYIDYSLFNIDFNQSNLYSEYKQMELLESKFALLSTMSEFIYNKDENENGTFSKEFIMRKYFLMSDEEWEENQDLLQKEKGNSNEEENEAISEEQPETDNDFGSDAGDKSYEKTSKEDFGAEDVDNPQNEIPAPEAEEEVSEKFDMMKSWLNEDMKIKKKYQKWMKNNK